MLALLVALAPPEPPRLVVPPALPLVPPALPPAALPPVEPPVVAVPLVPPVRVPPVPPAALELWLELEPPLAEEPPTSMLLPMALPGLLLPPELEGLELLVPPLPPLGLLELEDDDDESVAVPLCEGGARAQPNRTLIARRARMDGERDFMRVLLECILNPPGWWNGKGEESQTLRNGSEFGKLRVHEGRAIFSQNPRVVPDTNKVKDAGSDRGKARWTPLRPRVWRTANARGTSKP